MAQCAVVNCPEVKEKGEERESKKRKAQIKERAFTFMFQVFR